MFEKYIINKFVSTVHVITIYVCILFIFLDSRVVELDSSTESAEASPEVDRKAHTRRVVSSR